MIKQTIRELGHHCITKMNGRRKDLPLGHWGLTNSDQGLELHNVNLRDLSQKWGSPLHVVDMKRLEENLSGFLSSPQGYSEHCEVFVSYKTNPVPGIIKHLHALGAGAEVISDHELWLALKLGVPPEEIIYNGPAKSDASIEVAISKGILSLNINHKEEIKRVKAIAQKLSIKANVGIRVTFDQGWSGQFGIPSRDALEIYREALASPELNVVGFHCHRGVSIRTSTDLMSHLDGILAFLEQLQGRFDFTPEIVDIGGSLGIPTVRSLSPLEIRRATAFFTEHHAPSPKATLTPKEYVGKVIAKIVTDFSHRNVPVPRIIIEPGRALTGNCQMLLCRAVSTKASRNFTYAVLDTGVSIADCVQTEFHQIFPLIDKKVSKETYRLVGPICHLGDTLYHAWRFPKIDPGDTFAIMDSGAYFIPNSRPFSFPRPGVIGLHSHGEDVLLRAAETNEHVVSLDKLS